MTIDDLEEAKALQVAISECRKDLAGANWMVNKDVAPRRTYLTGVGDATITVPQVLFKSIGLVLKSELTRDLKELEKQLEAL